LPLETADAGESSTSGAPMTSMHFRANFNGSSFTQDIRQADVDATADDDGSLLSFVDAE
jgi:hypothetical protein